MNFFLIILFVVLLLYINFFNNRITLKIRKHIVGFILYYILISLVLIIIFDTQFGLSSVNDYFTSVLFIVGIIISFIIFLTNRNIIPSNKIIDAIDKIPEHIPFSHTLKDNLSSLIKVNYKIKVLLRTPDSKNYIWLLNQLSAYNAILQNDKSKNFNESIEFIFLDNTPDAISELFSKFDISKNNYILITSLSSIFKSTIEAREELSQNSSKVKNRIKLIGALSSISNDDINRIIDRDESIVRVFPPDYDEANTAMNFLFSRIISRVCVDRNCKLYSQKSNIIVLHSGTYGSAISKQCKKMFLSEQAGLKYITDNLESDKRVRDSIKFYSFNYTSSGEFVKDGDETAIFKNELKALSGDKNYFYIAGYEPNISSILNELDSVLTLEDCKNYSFLFCGTSSMHSWRKTILESLKRVQNIKNYEAFYLKLKLYSSHSSSLNMENKISDCKINFKYNNKNINIEDMLSGIKELDIDINNYCQLDENYITLLTQQSLEIAKEAVLNPNKSLVNAKYRIVHKDSDQKVDILINGDSINQYEIEKMEDISND